MTILKLVSKKDETVLAAVAVTEGLEEAKLEMWKKILRQLKLKWVEEEVVDEPSPEGSKE
jgi:hypothetical protein